MQDSINITSIALTFEKTVLTSTDNTVISTLVYEHPKARELLLSPSQNMFRVLIYPHASYLAPLKEKMDFANVLFR